MSYAVRIGARVWQVLLTAYAVGLLVWLALGTLPPLAAAVPAIHDEVARLAAGGGWLHPVAQRIVTDPGMFATGWPVLVAYLFSLLNLALGALLAVRHPPGPVPRLLALAFLGTAATFNEPSHVVFHLLGHAPLITGVHFAFHVVSGVAYLWAVVLFPVGRLPRRPWTPATGLAAAVVTAVLVLICWRSSFISHPPFFVAFFGILVPLAGLTAQSLVIAAPGTSGRIRQQARLLRLGLAPAFAAALLWLAGHAVGSGALVAHVESAFPGVFAVVPAVLLVAILRYRLWDIELLAARALAIAVLAAVAMLVQLVVLVGVGLALPSRGWVALAAMVLVALLVEPVRRTAGRLANRAVYGEELSPQQAVRALADRLSAPASGDGLGELVRIVVNGTRASSAEVWTLRPGALDRVASAPPAPSAMVPLPVPTLAGCVDALPGGLVLPVQHQAVLLAVLRVALPPGPLPPEESRILPELASHAGLLVANARLAADLADQVVAVTARAGALRASRREVALAQDAERRRLEHDIHDSAQQELASVLLQLKTAERAEASGRGIEARTLADLRAAVAATREDLDALCSGGVPPVLARGLPAALEAAAAPARRAGLAVELSVTVPQALPDEVAAAVWFCCSEALQNALKHAHASRIRIRVGVARTPHEDEVRFTVDDDGTGLGAGADGHGLSGLRERLVVLGGEVSVTSAPGAGALVVGRVPLPVLHQVVS